MSSTLRTCRVVALATFRNGLRGRIGFLAVASVFAVFLLGTMFRNFAENVGLERRLVLETGLALSALLVLGTAILLSCRGIGQGANRHGFQAILALPVPRHGVFLGHVVGISLTLLLYTVGMAIALSVVCWWRFSTWRWSLWVHFGTLFIEGVILVAIASLMALGGSTVVAFFGTLAVAIVAHAEGTVLHLTAESGNIAFDYLARGFLTLLPALGALDIKSCAVRGLAIPWQSLGWGTAHSVLYLVILVTVSAHIYRRVEP